MRSTRTAPALAVILALALAAPGGPAQAQDDGYAEGWDRLSEGARLLLRNLLSDMMPIVEELRTLIDDARLYHAPEVLPNGDIIIRRRRPGEDGAPAPDEGGEGEGPVDL